MLDFNDNSVVTSKILCIMTERLNREVELVPSEKSARVSHRRFLRNRSIRRSLRTFRSKAERLIAGGGSGDAGNAVREALSAVDRAARKGVIHPNKAARTKSRLTRRLNKSVASRAE